MQQSLCGRPQRIVIYDRRCRYYFSTTATLLRDFAASKPRSKRRHEDPSEDRGLRYGASHSRGLDQIRIPGSTFRLRNEEASGRHEWKERQRQPHTLVQFQPKTGELFSRANRLVPPAGRASPLVRRAASKQNQPFSEVIHERLDVLEQTLHADYALKTLELNEEDLARAFKRWRHQVDPKIDSSAFQSKEYKRLNDIVNTTSSNVFQIHLKYSFYDSILRQRLRNNDMSVQKGWANLRYPPEWFPATRAFQREFHLHVGPTNSGKTYHALKRLEEAETGLYAGPLRLLAHEVYMRLNAKGQSCNLITGDERKAADEEGSGEAPMSSCTVEMIPLNRKLDVAVIDEIQMIGSSDRGWAWTQAVLGVMAKEVHCCGEERAVPIMKELVAMCGEKLHVHRYKRLSPLQMGERSLDGKLKNLRKGDCVVAFSVMEIHALRQEIEKVQKCKVAIIYGSLPPETRAQQAQLFNDPDSGYDILVASNAIGMGLNLSIKRLVFVASSKFDGASWQTLSVADVKQIAGRAGRYSTATQDIQKTVSNLDADPSAKSAEISTPNSTVTTAIATSAAGPASSATNNSNVGYVTTLERFDFPVIQSSMAMEPEPLLQAGIQPPAYVIERFAKYFPAKTPFGYLLIRLYELSETNPRFFICDLGQTLGIADAIEAVQGLTTTDRLILCAAPIEPRKPGEIQLAQAYARAIAESRAMRIVDIDELDFDLLSDEYQATRGYLTKLEALHKGVIVWNWLSYRFTGVFIDRPLADHVKELVEKRIAEVLERMSFDYQKMRKSRERAIQDLLEQELLAKEQEQSSVPGAAVDPENTGLLEKEEEQAGSSVPGAAADPENTESLEKDDLAILAASGEELVHQREEEASDEESEVVDSMMDAEATTTKEFDTPTEIPTVGTTDEAHEDTGANDAAHETPNQSPLSNLANQMQHDMAEQDETLIDEADRMEDLAISDEPTSTSAKPVEQP